MGDKKARKLAFFATHPYCCFCGGGALATTEDHLPARSLFLNRRWPEGYVFPACVACNRNAADDELFMAFLVRARVSPANDDERREHRRAIEGVRARYPEFLQSIRRTPRMETRRRIEAIGGFQQFGLDQGSVTMVQMPPRAFEVATRYGEKLGKALYFMHTECVLPSTGESWARVLPNSVRPEAEIPEQLMGPLAQSPNAELKRGRVDLSSQFSYRYAVVDDGEACCFLVRFGEALSFLIITMRERDDELAHERRSKSAEAFSEESAT